MAPGGSQLIEAAECKWRLSLSFCFSCKKLENSEIRIEVRQGNSQETIKTGQVNIRRERLPKISSENWLKRLFIKRIWLKSSSSLSFVVLRISVPSRASGFTLWSSNQTNSANLVNELSKRTQQTNSASEPSKRTWKANLANFVTRLISNDIQINSVSYTRFLNHFVPSVQTSQLNFLI